ncbi:uncharacterized protein TNCT_170661 [Trichonephila clavata]|uniref:DNA-directed DNA polymerase n=1 Tax=Trichonephila clavata TaxID=2740835 RepID=A0A8X6LD51_TRICU|nr:uncharacterized protein TNCT_170661 [Trichonephila clavata]
MVELLCNHIQENISSLFICYGCLEGYENQLGHECMTYSNEQRISNYGDLAILNMDWDKLVADFVNRNIQMGCFHHGCEMCYDGDLIHPLAGTTMRSLRQKKEGVIDALRQRGYNIIQMLERDFVNLKKTEEFKEFLLQHEVTDQLNPRDALFGGRTNGMKLFFEGCAKYIDFTSLYPWVNKYCEYPVGHPEIITEHFQDIDSYFGLSSSNDLFRSYIDLFLKIKQEASGYPKGCLSEQQKSEYVISYSEKENIYLDKNSINIKDVFLPTPEIAAFQWTQSNNFVTQDFSTNIFIAAFTTCHARLKLYSEIEKLNESVLYFDTDSIIYKSDGINDPPLGNFLGEFTDELNGGTITSFVTGGPKNYAYKLSDGSEVCKIRGFTLNFQNSLVLNYNSVKELVKKSSKRILVLYLMATKKTVAPSGGKKKTIKRKNCFVT